MRSIMVLRKQGGCGKGLKSGDGGLLVALWNSEEPDRFNPRRPLLGEQQGDQGCQIGSEI